MDRTCEYLIFVLQTGIFIKSTRVIQTYTYNPRFKLKKPDIFKMKMVLSPPSLLNIFNYIFPNLLLGKYNTNPKEKFAISSHVF